MLRGEIVLSQDLAQQALHNLAHADEGLHRPAIAQPPAASPLSNLSVRQLDILERAAQGNTYKEIAAELSISEATVKYHMGQIIGLLQVENHRRPLP